MQCAGTTPGYRHYYTSPLTSVDASAWYQNGVVTAAGASLTIPDSTGGSLISKIAVPDGTGDYEINTTLALKVSGGNYIQYLHASPDALSANSGSYDSVELHYPNFVYNGCVATVSFFERVNGLVTLLGQTQILCRDGMQMRTVSKDNVVWLLYNNELLGVNVGLTGVDKRG